MKIYTFTEHLEKHYVVTGEESRSGVNTQTEEKKIILDFGYFEFFSRIRCLYFFN